MSFYNFRTSIPWRDKDNRFQYKFKSLEEMGGATQSYQQEQAKLRSEEREKEDRKLRRKKYIKDKKERQRQAFNETIAKIPAKVNEVHLDGIIGTKDVLVKNILSDLLKVSYIYNCQPKILFFSINNLEFTIDHKSSFFRQTLMVRF